MSFPEALAHGPIQQLFPDVYWVRGSVRMGPMLLTTRNMFILRNNGALTLINSVRLSESGERELEALGTVTHLLKIGAFHGMDDPYYLHRFKPKFWSLPKAKHAEGIKADVEMTAQTELPIPGASLFRFENTKFPEAAIRLPTDGGLLLTCDSVQHWTTTEGASLLMKGILRAGGFMRPAVIGLPWRRAMAKPDANLYVDFQRLLQEPFQHLMGGHGSLLSKNAKETLASSVARTFGV
jgi:hypothetical protein